MEEAQVQEHSIDLLNEFIVKHQTVEFLTLAESFGQSNPFIDQDRLLFLLHNSWKTLTEGYKIERDITRKRIKLLKEDKKADPEVLQRQESLLVEIDQKRANVLIPIIRLRTMMTIEFSNFKNDKFDYMKVHNENLKLKKHDGKHDTNRK
jgi:hypothetical protein